MTRDSINMFASQRLIELLSKINHAISHDLLEQIRYRGRTTISYLDFGETSDSISFIYSNKMYELQKEFNNNYLEKVWKEKRSDIKVGKIIRLIFPDRYPINNPKGQPMSKIPIDIESFVNMYKAEREKNENSDRFSIVNGEEIVYWYNYKNYTRFVHEDTPLGKSCLRYEESARFLEMYLKNPDKAAMLILKDDEGKLRGRAIVWTLDLPEGRTYMDRIYSVNDYDIELFKDFARTNGWLHKERQTFGWNNNIIDTKDNILYSPKNILLQITLTNKKLKYYPYLDTLSVYNKKTGILNNRGELLRTEGHIHLIDYQGSYVDEVDHREYVYSEYHNEDILRENAVFCQVDDDWVYEDDTVYVHNTDGLRAIKGSENVVCSKILSKTKYFLKESAVFSDYLNTYIYKDSVREAFIDPEKTQKVIIHFKMIGKTFMKDINGDIIKGEPKKEDKPLKKKYDTKKKISDLDSLFSTPSRPYGEVEHPRPSLVERIVRSHDDDHDDDLESIGWNHEDGPRYDTNGEEEGNGEGRSLPRSRRRHPTSHSNPVSDGLGNIGRRLLIDPGAMYASFSVQSQQDIDNGDRPVDMGDGNVVMDRPIDDSRTVNVNYRTGVVHHDTPSSTTPTERSQSSGRSVRFRPIHTTENEQIVDRVESSQPSTSNESVQTTENLRSSYMDWVLPGGVNIGTNLWDAPNGYDVDELYNRMVRASGIPLGYLTATQQPNSDTPQDGNPESEPDEEILLDDSDIGDNYHTEEHREFDIDDLDLD